ncbi:MAG: Uma2 family endonuclease [Deltaproteobacteria bacterium]|nr:Uma2 family endonuclease [Deltaproteobacteria bacterium]
MTATPKPSIPVEDYLAQERSGSTRNEYFAGDVFAMAGGSEAHNLIAGNTYAGLHAQFRLRPCRVYPSDMRVKISQTSLYTYPDISIVCGQSQFEDDHRDTLLNPTVIIEVLSPSTESYDRGKKFQNYRMIASLQEYLLISQDARHIEHYVRQSDHNWLLSEVSAMDDVIFMPSVESKLAVSDVYEKIDLL